MLDSFINMKILANPINWLVVTMTLIFVSYAMYAIWSNSSTLLPRLPAAA